VPDLQNLHREAYKDLFTTRVIASSNPGEQQWLTASLNAGRMNSAFKLAESIESTSVHPNQMDTNMRELVTPGGIMNLITGEFRPMNPLVDRHTKVTNVAPDFSGPPLAFIQFLMWAFHGDAEMVAYIRRLLGLACIGELREQIFPVFLGAGANGKSTLFDILLAIFGPYAIKMGPSFLVATKGSAIPEQLAQMKGTRLAFASEVPPKSTFDEELVKSITGDSFIRARKLFENSEGFDNTTTLFGAFNHAPAVAVGGPSWWRRMRLIKMIASVPDAQQDTMLRQRLVEQEGGKILGWILQGTQDYLRNGIQTPAKVTAATAEYRLSEDDLARFVDAELTRTPGARVTRAGVYARYVAFMNANRLFQSLLSEPKFVREFLVVHPDARVVDENGNEDLQYFGEYNLIVKEPSFDPQFPFAR
jgi:putative DNA primase/helicase